MAFGQQRHPQKDRRRGHRKSDADFGIAIRSETPLQGGPDIVDAGKVRGALRASRQGRPIDPGLLQPSAVVGRVAHGQVGQLGVFQDDLECVGPRRIKKPVAHHRANRTGCDHRFRDKAVDSAKNERAINARTGHDSQRRIEGEMPDEHREPAQHHAL